MNNRLISASITALALTAAHQASAQSFDYGALQSLFGEPVTTSATGSPQRSTDVPVDMTIITADDIKRSGADNIPDILQFVPGLNVQRLSFQQAEVSVRGYDQPFSPRLLVLVNGRQVYLDSNGYTSWSNIPVQLDEIRQIEVVRGPNSALYGFNAVAGVINIITYDALTDHVESLTARGGSQSDAQVSGVATVHLNDRVGIRLSAGVQRSNEFKTGAIPITPGGIPVDAHPLTAQASLSTHIQLTPKADVSFEATTTGSRFNEETAGTLGLSNDQYRTTSFKMSAAADTTYGLLNLNVYRNASLAQFGTINSNQYNDLNNVGYVVQGSDLFKISVHHTVRFAFEYRDTYAYSPLFDVARNPQATVGYHTYAVSAMWNWQISPKLSLTNSARVDYLTTYYAGSLGAYLGKTESALQAGYNEASITAPTFNSGLVYKPYDGGTLRLQVSRGVETPSLFDLGLQIQGPGFTLAGVSSLRPSYIVNYEIDYDWRLAPINSVLRVSAYHTRTTDVLSAASNAPIAFTSSGALFLAQNIGDTSSTGGEISLSGSNVKGFRWSASYDPESISDSLSVDHGQITPISGGGTGLFDFQHGTPKTTLLGSLGYTAGPFEFDAQTRWQSHYVAYGYTASNLGLTVAKPVNDFATLSGRIAYHVSAQITAAVSGQQINQERILQSGLFPVERRILFTLSWGK